jgi:hypothetical protein
MTPPPPQPVLPLVPGFERVTRKRPLPDAAAVRLLLVPDSAPPYDDRALAAVHREGPSGSPDVAQPYESLERVAPPSPGEAPGWPSQFAQVLAETLAGSRSQGQIAPWTSDQARRRIRQLGPMLAAGATPRVRRVMTSHPAAGVVEMTVIVGCGPKVRALAVRLERDGRRGARPAPDARQAGAARWICTAVEAA